MDNDNEPGPVAPPDDVGELRRAPVPPAALEGRVVDALRAEGLVRPRAAWSRLVQFAAALAIFSAGAYGGHRLWPEAPAPPRPAAAARYLLLLAGDVTPASDGSTRAAEYGAWARDLALRGIRVTGEELTDHAAVVTAREGARFGEIAGVGGYFLIEAGDDAAAAALARTCPHVKYGGSVIVRRVTSARR